VIISGTEDDPIVISDEEMDDYYSVVETLEPESTSSLEDE